MLAFTVKSVWCNSCGVKNEFMEVGIWKWTLHSMIYLGCWHWFTVAEEKESLFTWPPVMKDKKSELSKEICLECRFRTFLHHFWNTTLVVGWNNIYWLNLMLPFISNTVPINKSDQKRFGDFYLKVVLIKFIAVCSVKQETFSFLLKSLIFFCFHWSKLRKKYCLNCKKLWKKILK